MSLSPYRVYALGLRCSAHGHIPCQALRRNLLSRTYATDSALASKKKGLPSAKATRKSTAVSSASPTRTSAKVEERAAGHLGHNQSAAEVKTLPLRTKSAGVHATVKGTTSVDTPETPLQNVPKASVKEPELSAEEQQLKELEALQYFAQVMRTADPYGQPIPQSLDVVLFRPASFKNGLMGWWNQFSDNRVNDAKNAMSLLYLAADNTIPGVQLGKAPWYKAIGWIFKSFKVKSTKDNTWVAPLRRMLLESYAELNKTVASGDIKKAKVLTTSDYQSEILRRIKKQPAGFRFKWNLEREVSPIQIVSFRTTQYYMAKEDPKFGSRYLIHALVKFDTEQTLEIYGRNGEPLHEVAEGAVKRPNGTIAAKPKRVTEYLLVERRLWYDAPWVFREQMWDTPASKI